MSEKSFDNLSDALNMDYLNDDSINISSRIEKFSETKDQAKALVASKEYNLEDTEYMQMELKMLIQGGLNILDKLEQDISIGSKVSSHQTYFIGMKSIMDAIKELRELNRAEVDVSIAKKKETGGNGVIVNQFYDSTSLLDMLEQAKESNSLNEITAEFKIDEDEDAR